MYYIYIYFPKQFFPKTLKNKPRKVLIYKDLLFYKVKCKLKAS